MKKFTILIAAIALVCFTVPAMAVDWNFYGSARMETWYDSRDFGDFNNAAGTDTKDAQLDWANMSSQRLGANVKAENIKAQVEFSIADQGVSARRLYGIWNFGAGSMKVGKDYTPVKQFISAQGAFEDLGLLGIGTAYGSRRAQIAFLFGGFDIALITPATGQIFTSAATATTGTATAGDVDPILPKLEAAWGMSYDAWSFKLLGGYQYYKIQDVTTATGGTEDVDVTSYILGGDVGFNFGPAYVKAAASYGSNVGNAAWNLGNLWYTRGVEVNNDFAGGQFISGLAVYDGDDGTDDTTTWMAALVGGFKVSDMLSLEAGFGYRSDDPDANNLQKANIYSVYVNSTIALAPGVYLIPEISYFNYDKSSWDVANDDNGSQIVIGGKWQIDF